MKLLGSRLFPVEIKFSSTTWLLLGIALLSSCKSPQVEFEEETRHQAMAWKQAVESQETLEFKDINWDLALEKLQSHNVELLRAQAVIEDSRNSIKRVRNTLLPNIFLQSSNNTPLDDLDDLTLDQFSFRLYGFFNLSGLINFYPRIFAAKLSTIYAEITYKLKEREQIIELYRLFLEADATNTQLDQLTNALRFLENNENNFSLSILDLVKQKTQLESLRTNQANKLSQLIGDHSQFWIPVARSLPDLEYQIPEDLTQFAAQNFGNLDTEFYALEIIKARADIKRIRFQRWPDFNLALSGPPIVQNSLGETTYWSTDNVRLNAWAFWNFDTQGLFRSQLKSKQRLNDIQIKEIQQTRANSARKMLNLLNQLKILQKQKQLLDEKLQDPNLELVIKDTLQKEDLELEREILEYGLLLLFFDNEFNKRIELEVAP